MKEQNKKSKKVEIREYKVLVATPVRDGKFYQGYVEGFSHLSSFNGKKLTYQKQGKNQVVKLYFTWGVANGVSDIVSGRDLLANEFYQLSGHDAILWIDADTGFNGAVAVQHIIRSFIDNEEAFTLPQPRKVLHEKENPFTLSLKDIVFEPKEDSKDEDLYYGKEKMYTKGCGFGFFFVARPAFDKVNEKLKGMPHLVSRIVYETQIGEDVEGLSYHQRMMMRRGEKETPKMLSEDKSFCFRLESAGVKIRVYPATVKHSAESMDYHLPFPFTSEEDRKDYFRKIK